METMCTQLRNNAKNFVRDFVSEEFKTSASSLIKKGELVVGSGVKEGTTAGINLLSNGNKFTKYALKVAQSFM